MSFSLTYTVDAASRVAAIEKAVGMIRSDVRLRGVNSATELQPGRWAVSLNLWEDV